MTTRGTALSPREVEPGRAAPETRRRKPWLEALRTRAPFNWPPKRKRRWAIALLLLLLAYPVFGTLALWTGAVSWLLKSEDLRVELQNPAYTIWPGRVHVKHARILANGTTQFILAGHDLLINVRMLELVKRRVHVTELSAHDVTYQMRVQVKDKQGIEERLAAYPPLRDLPGANVIRESTAKNTEETDSDFTVEVEGLDVAAKELWFFEYRYLGKAHLTGGFVVGPNVMEVSTAVQDIGPGDLRFGAEETVASDIKGQITADIPRLNPKEHADASFMDLVTARVNLRAAVQSLRNLSAYAPGLRVSRGSGPLSFDLYLDRGRLGQKSKLDFRTDSLRVMGNGFGVETDVLLKFDAGGAAGGLPLVRNATKSTYVSVARGAREFTIQVHGHHEEARLDTVQLSRSTDLQSASLRMPDIRSVDLQDLPVLLPPDVPLEVRKGTARGSLKLDMDSEYWTHGPLEIDVEDLEAEAAGVRIAGDLGLRSGLRVNPKLETYRTNLTLTLRDVNTSAGRYSASGWWLNLVGKDFTYAAKPSRFDGIVSVRARDLAPLLQALAEKEVVSKIIPMLTSLSDFRASANLHTADTTTDVSLASESEVWDVAGRVYKKGDQSKFALVLGGQAVSLGIANLGGGLELMPFAKTGWLNEKLAGFPKPLVRMQPEKP